MERLTLLWALVRRDYAMQYAGSFLGISWMLLQNLTLISLYSVVFLVFQWRNIGSEADYTAYLLSGLLFWIPLQELLVRGTAILAENRSLLKRSTLGADLFLWVPYIQYLIHAFVTFIPVCILLIWKDQCNLLSIFAGFGWLTLVGLYLLLLLHYLSRLNVLLKDISPLVRLLSSLLFWAVPVLYYPTGILKTWNELNPFTIPLDIFRELFLNQFEPQFAWSGFFPFLIAFVVVFILSRWKLHTVIADHL